MKRLLVLAYGIISYIAFFAVFLYFIGFVADLRVPRTVNSGSSAGAMRAILIDTGLICLFALQHLVMARQWFKRWWIQVVPAPIERSTFVLAASFCLMLLVLLWQPIPAVVWKVEAPIPQWIILTVSSLGWVLVVYSSFLIDHFDLFGIKQAYLHFRNRAYTPVPFKVSSLYRWVRHPMMLGFLMALWSTPVMTVGHLLLAAELTVFIMVGLRFEERDLVRWFGRTYEAYRRETSMVIPTLKKRDRTSLAPGMEHGADVSFGCSDEAGHRGLGGNPATPGGCPEAQSGGHGCTAGRA